MVTLKNYSELEEDSCLFFLKHLYGINYSACAYYGRIFADDTYEHSKLHRVVDFFSATEPSYECAAGYIEHVLKRIRLGSSAYDNA
jgi:hypothetical protein